MSFSPKARAWIVGAISACGLALSLVAENLHRELHQNASYASFCNINSRVNCDVVLTSPWASFLGTSVSLLGIVFYAGLLALAIAVASSGQAARRRRLAGLLFLGTAGGLLFSLYMATVAFVVLKTVCLICSGLYVVAVFNFLAAWWLQRSVQPAFPRTRVPAADRPIRIAAAVLLGALALAIGWEGIRGFASPDSPTLVEHDPKFSQWFLSQPLLPVSVDSRNQRGPADAPITIVEFSDFECGHCNQFRRVLEEVWRRDPRRLRVVFRHFPLNSDCNPAVPSPFHKMACIAAVAAECAGEQNKFWEYHDLVFAHQRELQPELFPQLARKIGLDLPKFSACLENPEMLRRVEQDSRLGAELGVNSTPTFFVNGRMIRGALNSSDLRRAIALAQAEGNER